MHKSFSYLIQQKISLVLDILHTFPAFQFSTDIILFVSVQFFAQYFYSIILRCKGNFF